MNILCPPQVSTSFHLTDDCNTRILKCKCLGKSFTYHSNTTPTELLKTLVIVSAVVHTKIFIRIQDNESGRLT